MSIYRIVIPKARYNYYFRGVRNGCEPEGKDQFTTGPVTPAIEKALLFNRIRAFLIYKQGFIMPRFCRFIKQGYPKQRLELLPLFLPFRVIK
jgi:hypothetical protein